jgi:hypothetical protein
MRVGAAVGVGWIGWWHGGGDAFFFVLLVESCGFEVVDVLFCFV